MLQLCKSKSAGTWHGIVANEHLLDKHGPDIETTGLITGCHTTPFLSIPKAPQAQNLEELGQNFPNHISAVCVITESNWLVQKAYRFCEITALEAISNSIWHWPLTGSYRFWSWWILYPFSTSLWDLLLTAASKSRLSFTLSNIQGQSYSCTVPTKLDPVGTQNLSIKLSTRLKILNCFAMKVPFHHTTLFWRLIPL